MASSVPEKNERSLISTLKISPFAVKDYLHALSRYSTEKIIGNLSLIREADLKLKGVNSGSEGESEIFKELVFRLLY